MRNLIGLITLLSITVSNAHAQVRTERIEFDTVFDGGYFHFHMDTQGRLNNNSRNSGFGEVSIINNVEAEHQRLIEEERRAIAKYIDSRRVVFFTNIIELTASEAAVFWPEYENYQQKLDKIQEKRGEANAKMCDPFRKYKIKEYQAFVDVEVKSYREEAQLREQYAAKFKDVLGSKLYLLYRAEYLFRKWIYSTF
jgi:hypothetical protein